MSGKPLNRIEKMIQLAKKKNEEKAEKARARPEEFAAPVGADPNIFTRANMDENSFDSDSDSSQLSPCSTPSAGVSGFDDTEAGSLLPLQSGAKRSILSALKTPTKPGQDSPEKRMRMPDTPLAFANMDITGLRSPPQLEAPPAPSLLPDHFFTPNFFLGNAAIPVAFFLGREGQLDWDVSQLFTYFFHTKNGPTLVCRADKVVSGRVPIAMVLNQVVDIWWTANRFNSERFRVENPILTYKDLPVHGDLFSYPNKATFIVSEGEIAPEYLGHNGQLWQCTVCKKSYQYHNKFAAHNKGHKNALFASNMTKTLGRIQDQLSPWGCPPGHSGRQGFVDQPLSPTPSPSSSSRAPLSASASTMAPGFTSLQGTSGVSRARRELPTLAAAPPGFSQGSPTPSLGSDTTALRKSSRVAAKGPVAYDNLDGDEDESSGEDQAPSGGSDTDSDSITPGKKGRKANKLRTLCKRQKLPLTDSEDSGDDSVRKVGKARVRQLMKNAAKEPMQETEIWYPDTEDENDMKQYVAKYAMISSNKYRRKKFLMPSHVRTMIEHGEFPTESKDGKYVASTPRLYVNALIRLLGKLQKHLSDWQPESLPDGRLHLRQFFAFRTPQFLYLPNIIDMLV